MSTAEDEDLQLQRASASLLAEFGAIIPRLLRKRKHGSDSGPVRQSVREGDMFKACSLVCGVYI